MRERQWKPRIQMALAATLVLATACSNAEDPGSGTNVCGHLSPRPSESGSRYGDIVYASDLDGNPDLWHMRPDGSHQTPLASGEGLQVTPAWAPGGNLLAYTGGAAEDVHSAPTDICRINLNAGQIINLTGTEDTWESTRTWS